MAAAAGGRACGVVVVVGEQGLRERLLRSEEVQAAAHAHVRRAARLVVIMMTMITKINK